MDGSRRLVRVVLAGVAVVLAASPLVLDAGIPASAGTKTPTVTIEPATGITDPFNDGQYVIVTWKNFAPNQSVGAKECAHDATDTTQCSRPALYSSCGFLCPGDWILGTSDANGNGSGSIPIATGKINVEQDLST